MSGPFALAAVSAVLRNLLTNGLGNVDLSIFGGAATTVTAHPPDLIQVGANEPAQLNLFLYQATPNAALRNVGLPSRGANGGERLTNAPLALDLHYLLTAYGAQEFHPEALLGYGMQVLHEVPFLSRQMIRDTLPLGVADPVLNALAGAELADQIEYIKIVPQVMTTEEMFRVWSATQAKYRPSAVYLVTVALIELKQNAKSPLPVLKQGENDRGPLAVGGLIPPYPEIGAVSSPNNQPAALLGDVAAISGHDFTGEAGNPNAVEVTARLNNARLQVTREITIPVNQRSANAITLTIPNDPANLPSGLYALSILVAPNGRPLEARESNEAPLLIAPRITTAMPASFGAGQISLSVSPEIRPGQRVSLVLGGREFIARPLTAQSATVTFDVSATPAGVYWTRLRVDGVESLLVDRSDPKNINFDPTQQITIT
jgi:hypothetical protein